jgi:hypothetical protein
MDSGSQQIDYKTHILIGYVSKGTMGVIFHWPHLPRQEEVQQKIDAVRETYAAFLLCTPTSIMPVKRKRFVMGKQGSSRPFRPR